MLFYISAEVDGDVGEEGLDDDGYDPFEDAAGALREFLQKDESVMFLGQGISRFAFAQRNGNVSKFAVDYGGYGQNGAEIKTLRKYAGFRCFPKLYDFDDRRLGGLEVEALADVVGDFGKAKSILEGMGLAGVKNSVKGVDIAVKIACEVCIDVAIKMACNEIVKNGDFVEMDVDDLSFYSSLGFSRLEIEVFARNVIEGKTVQARVFGDLVRYYTKQMRQNLQYITDFHLGNWGYAWRDGEIAFVLLDAGL